MKSNLKNLTFKNILIVRTDRLGDVILTTPMITALRKKFPSSRLTILVSKNVKDIVANNPDLDEVIAEDRKNEHRGFLGTLKLIQLLKSKEFDLAIILHTKKRTNFICFLAGIPRRLGYKNEKCGFLLTDPILDERHLGKKHEAQLTLDVLKPLGIESHDLTLTVNAYDKALPWIKNFKSEHHIDSKRGLCLIHASASDPSRCWSARRFVELMKLIKNKYNPHMVLIGQANARSVSDEILKLFTGEIIDLIGKTELFQLISLVKESKVLLSNDSGPVHLAAALNRPVVAVFSRNQPGVNPERWAPLGALSRSVSVAPNMDLDFKKSGKVAANYLEVITAEEVFAEVDALLKSC